VYNTEAFIACICLCNKKNRFVLQVAYSTCAGITANVNELSETELGAGDISGLTLLPGVYKWSSTVVINTDLTLQGDGEGYDSVWIFQIAHHLTLAAGTNVILTNGAIATNIFWQVAGAVTLGVGSHFEGTILCQTSIAMNTGASINGRLLAETGVTLQTSTVTMVSSISPTTVAPTASSAALMTHTAVPTASPTASPTTTLTPTTSPATTPAPTSTMTPTSQPVRIPLELNSCGDFVILTKSGITSVPNSVVTGGNIGASPITGAAIILTCSEVTEGTIYAVDTLGPAGCSTTDPTTLTSAIGDMEVRAQ